MGIFYFKIIKDYLYKVFVAKDIKEMIVKKFFLDIYFLLCDEKERKRIRILHTHTAFSLKIFLFS